MRIVNVYTDIENTKHEVFLNTGPMDEYFAYKIASLLNDANCSGDSTWIVVQDSYQPDMNCELVVNF